MLADGRVASELCLGIVLSLASQGEWSFCVPPVLPDIEGKGGPRDAIDVCNGRERV